MLTGAKLYLIPLMMRWAMTSKQEITVIHDLKLFAQTNSISAAFAEPVEYRGKRAWNLFFELKGFGKKRLLVNSKKQARVFIDSNRMYKLLDELKIQKVLVGL